VGGTLLAGGKGSYWGTMAGALVLQVLSSLLLALGVEEALQLVIYGAILLVLITFYGRQRSLRQ
jgi:ribose transport system permease protein